MKPPATPELIHEIIPVGLLQCNCMILGDPVTREAVVIDPGDEPARILAVLKKHGLTVRAILITHTHFDHVAGIVGLSRATQAPVLIHKADLELYRHLNEQPQWVGLTLPPAEQMDLQDFLSEGDRVRWGNFFAEVRHTPGHTPGSISLVVQQNEPGSAAHNPAAPQPSSPSMARPAGRVIAGDTLFFRSIGRTDFPGGSFPELLRSIREKLYTLPDETIVYPGHGDRTTIGEERALNPFVR